MNSPVGPLQQSIFYFGVTNACTGGTNYRHMRTTMVTDHDRRQNPGRRTKPERRAPVLCRRTERAFVYCEHSSSDD